MEPVYEGRDIGDGRVKSFQLVHLQNDWRNTFSTLNCSEQWLKSRYMPCLKRLWSRSCKCMAKSAGEGRITAILC